VANKTKKTNNVSRFVKAAAVGLAVYAIIKAYDMLTMLDKIKLDDLDWDDISKDQ
jgi:hypothetical protein